VSRQVIGTEDRQVTYIGKFDPTLSAQATRARAANVNDDPADRDSDRGGAWSQRVHPWGARVAATRLNSVGMGILVQYLRQRTANAPSGTRLHRIALIDVPLSRS
jgi:hypothetical protein